MPALLTHDERFHHIECPFNSIINYFGVKAVVVDPTGVLRTTNDLVNMVAEVGPYSNLNEVSLRTRIWVGCKVPPRHSLTGCAPMSEVCSGLIFILRACFIAPLVMLRTPS